MEQFKKLKLFPDRWFKKLTGRELQKARERLTSYTVAKDIDTSLCEVTMNFIRNRDEDERKRREIEREKNF